MTLYQFIALDKNEQAREVWQGEFLLTREELSHTVALYRVHSFYVEVYYNATTNAVDRFNPFLSLPRLALFFNAQLN